MARRNRNYQPVVKDWHLWTEVTRSVSPLRQQVVAKLAEPPSPAIGAPRADPAMPKPLKKSDLKLAWSPQQRSGLAQHVHVLPQQPGKSIEPRMRRRLMRGQLAIDATLDLHGLRQHEAHAALSRFITARSGRGDRTVLIITGKGLKKTGRGQIEQKGVLRSMLPIWLSEKALHPLIAGWEPSAQAHGGEGAYYVRLRRLEK